jgi:DNA-binding response OmpR family regulator
MLDLVKSRHICEVVLVSDYDVRAKSLGSVLESSGYAVHHATTLQESRDLACSGVADAVIVLAKPFDMNAIDVCRRLQGDPEFDATTPLLVVVSSDCTRAERLEVMSAGAWETSPEPIDGEVLLLKLQPFMRMRRAVGKLNERTLIDPATGLYSFAGLVRRSHEIAAHAMRRKQPLSMVAIERPGPDTPRGSPVVERDAISKTGVFCRHSIRATDALGRVGRHGFLCIAPDADSEGALAIITRLQHGLETALATQRVETSAHFRAGYCATSSLATSSTGAVEMMFRALQLASDAPMGQMVGESV